MKPVLWIPAAKRNLMDMPEAVVTDIGYALYQAQLGGHPDIAKPLKGFGNANVLELVANHDSDTYRVVYTVRFSDALVVVHAFQKKSKQGIKTPKQEIELIHDRLKRAEDIYKEWKASKEMVMTKRAIEYELSEDNIFADLGLKQPEELMAKAKLLYEVGSLIKASHLSQIEIAEKLGISQPKVSLLISGRLSAFSTDSLLHYLSLLGCNVEIRVRKPRSRIGIFRHKGRIAVC